MWLCGNYNVQSGNYSMFYRGVYRRDAGIAGEFELIVQREAGLTVSFIFLLLAVYMPPFELMAKSKL